VSNLKERLFYIKKTAENHWSKERMIDEIKGDLYHHQSSMPNNFAQTLPSKVSALKAISMFKDNYLLEFVNMEELNAREKDVDEKVLEQEIVQHIKDFIMAFGKDFAFVGNQYHLEKFGVEQFPDLLFYNRELSALVVVELKIGSFKPAYLGQLSAYLRILDTEVKKPFENPSIGIILCKDANKSFVEFLIQGYDNPMGVATYKTAEDVRRVLPSEDDLRKIIDQEF
jgi:predicted nuclease of restriction endonuclease-like (RecB) superfamily